MGSCCAMKDRKLDAKEERLDLNKHAVQESVEEPSNSLPEEKTNPEAEFAANYAKFISHNEDVNVSPPSRYPPK